jgi:mRNA-degrading endonuclease toxin of MazEF toxin-antitoxin module
MTIADVVRKVFSPKVRITNGGIYRIRESAIDFRENRAPSNHPFRSVVVMSNQATCDSTAHLTVSVAVMSHKLSPVRPTDLIVPMNPRNGLDKDARIILSHIQPVLKTALEKQFGTLADDEWNAVMGKVVQNFDRQ